MIKQNNYNIANVGACLTYNYFANFFKKNQIHNVRILKLKFAHLTILKMYNLVPYKVFFFYLHKQF